ncbi:DUF3558 family protein [Actinokineospora sp. UTMC 2448]|uniref:DUF3558 family protein n=1 Tax=Actinokineospora sp. UTMC 2448 TaxID=2268449 RepID=UPI0021646B4C|nr:DUF3558 family protein [Actinokineospora sp. UTMC 2448]
MVCLLLSPVACAEIPPAPLPPQSTGTSTSAPLTTVPPIDDPISLERWAGDPCGLLQSPIRFDTVSGSDSPAAELSQVSRGLCVATWPGESYRVEVEIFTDRDILGEEYAKATTDLRSWIPDMRIHGFPAIGHVRTDVLCRLTIGVADQQGLQFRQTPMQPPGSHDRCLLNRKVQEEAMYRLVKSTR